MKTDNDFAAVASRVLDGERLNPTGMSVMGLIRDAMQRSASAGRNLGDISGTPTRPSPRSPVSIAG